MQANSVLSPSAGSATCVLELQTPTRPLPSRGGSSNSIRLSSPSPSTPQNEAMAIDTPGSLPTPITAVPVLQRWNQPRINVFRILGTFFSFVILGGNDAAIGALIPYIEAYYHIDYTTVSLIFLSPVCGYVASSMMNNAIHMKFGQRGIAMAMGVCHTVAYLLVCLHIPYPALVFVFILGGFGNGLGDSAWNAWVGDMQNHNEVLGFLHASYGLGGTLAPLIATALVTKAHWMWFEYYYLMLGMAVLELIFLTTVFWKADAAQFREEHPKRVSGVDNNNAQLIVDEDREGEYRGPPRDKGLFSKIRPLVFGSSTARPARESRTLEAIKNKNTLLLSAFLLVYVGVEVSIGGWIVTFMLRVRHGSPFASGLVSTGFWLGVTVGRVVLGFVTPRLFKSEKHAVAAYLILSIGLQLLFWLVPQFIVSAVMVGLLGFFLAPLFPAAVVAITKLLPKAQHVPAVGFAAATGASGATVFPFAVGAIANKKGVQVLQPIVLAMLVVCLGVWLLIPKLPKMRTA